MHCTNTPPNHHQERSVFVLSFINSDPSFTARVMNTDLSVLCFTVSLLYFSSKVVKDENIKNFYTMNTSSLIVPYCSLLSHILFLLCASFVLPIFLYPFPTSHLLTLFSSFPTNSLPYIFPKLILSVLTSTSSIVQSCLWFRMSTYGVFTW